jgi:hypothetical protein
MPQTENGSYVSYSVEEHNAMIAAQFVETAYLQTAEGPLNPTHIVHGFVKRASGWHPEHDDDLVTWFTPCVEISSGRSIAVGPNESTHEAAAAVLNGFLKRAHTLTKAYWV